MPYPSKRTPDQKDYVAMVVSTAADGLSDVADMGGLSPVALETSTAWTAAGIDFLGSQRSSGSLKAVHASSSTGPLIRMSSDAISASTGRLLTFDPYVLNGFRYLQLKSASTNSTAVVQQAARTVYVYLGVPGGPIK